VFVAAALLLIGAAAAQTGPAAVIALPPVEVIAATPLAGAGIDRDKVPGTVQTLRGEDFDRTGSAIVTDTLFQRIPGITLSDPNGNNAQQELGYRGFLASPLQGTPQGVAVYLGGIRFNETFGDTVNWDLIPTNAIDRADLWTNNPIFGLNALGGAVSLQMKNGFTYRGYEAELQGGSFGRVNGGVQYGAEGDGNSLYVAAQGLHEAGWRRKSPADVARGYIDFGWRNSDSEFHLVGAGASTSFGVAAATPIELLNRDRAAIFTTPQTTDNAMALVGINGKYAVSDTWSLQGNVYVRHFRQSHRDGNVADIERCSNSSSPQFRNQLCLEDDGFPRPNPVTAAFRDQFAILDQSSNPIPCPPGTGNTCATVPFGTIDRTANRTTTLGASLQASSTERLFGHGNYLVVGGSIDHGLVSFDADSLLGTISPDLTVTASPVIPGAGAVVHTLGGLGYGPVGTSTTNTYYGLYALDTFDATDRLSLTAGGRFNIADISVSDRLGTSPELNSHPSYTRLNPVAGLSYRMAPDLTGYFGYSESNRAPTALELGCSSAIKPCLLENFLVADPPLKQVVGRTYEAGIRNTLPIEDGKLSWKAALFRTDISNDIVNVASAVQGRGFFQNVPATRRQGIEAGLQFRSEQWLVYAGYSLIDATYQFAGDLPSPNNPFADENGNVHVTPGKRIPGIPLHQGKLGFTFKPTPRWAIGADLTVVGDRFFVGDESNQNNELPGYWLVALNTSYQLTENVQIFGIVNNLFDKRYALFGTYFDPQEVRNVGLPVQLTDGHTEVLGAPFAIYGGIRVTF
jgi:iron complex outermembrane receptor protein